jgi:hypothetical protein
MGVPASRVTFPGVTPTNALEAGANGALPQDRAGRPLIWVLLW